MPFNVSGVFERLYNWATDRDNGVKINAPRMDAETDGIVAGLNAVVSQTQPFIGPVKAPSGTVALPGFAFSGDPDTGMYNPAANEWAVSLGGAQALLLNSTLLSTSRIIRSGNGTASAPALSNASFTNSGVYFDDGGASVAVARSGVQVLKFSATNSEIELPISGPALRDVTFFVHSVTKTSPGGVTDVYTMNLNVGAAARTGMEIRFIPPSSNTFATTNISFAAIGTHQCRTPNGSFIPAGYLVAGIPTRAYFNGTDWIVDREPEVITSPSGLTKRYADGTQIFTHVFDTGGTGSAVLSYPVAFSGGAPNVQLTPTGSAREATTTGTGSITGITIISRDSGGALLANQSIFVRAEGRWY